MQTLTGPVQLLASAWALFKAHRKFFITLTLIPLGISCLSQLAASTKNPALIVLGGLAGILGAVLSIVLQPALINSAQKLHTEPGAVLSAKTQLGYGFRYFGVILGLGVLQSAMIIGAGIFFIIPAIIVGVYGGFYLFTRLVDERKGLSAFTESYAIVKDRWWAVVGRGLFLGFIYVLAGFINAGILFVVGKIFGLAPKSVGLANVSLILDLILNTVLVPVVVLYSYGLYTSLKASRSPSAQPEKFRKWLIFFIGAAILAAVSVLVAAMNFAITH